MNIKNLETQIDLLIEQYRHCKTVNKARFILSSIASLLELYQDITQKQYKKISEVEDINSVYYQKYVEYNNRKRNIFIKEFFKNREFHYQFILDIVNKFQFLDYESEYVIPKSYSEKDLESILKDYSFKSNSNYYEMYQQFRDKQEIFVVDKQSECGATSYDWYNNIQYISLCLSENTIENLVSLVHELGHIEDEKDLDLTKTLDYRDKSIFTEVNSLYREKQFYNFLLNNGLYVEEVRSEVLFEPHSLLENLMNLMIYSKIPKNYINTNDFKYQWIDEALKEVDFGLDIFLDNYECINLYDVLIYSYGELLGTYFSENEDKYLLFRDQRYNSYSPKILSKLDITSDDIVKSLYKRYDRYKRK